MALSIARMADAVGNSILFILIPLYVAQIPTEHINLAVSILVGILVSFFGFTTSLLQPFTGALSDWLDRRKLLILIGLGIIAVSTFSFVFAENYLHLLLLRIFQGIGVGLTIPASLSLMTSITQKKSRGGSMGIFSTFRIIGFAVGPVVGGFLYEHYGFNTAFYVGSAFIVIAMLLVQIWVDEVQVEAAQEQGNRFKIFDRSLYGTGITTTALAVFSLACCFSMMITLENAFNARLDITAIGFSIAFSMLMVGRLFFQIPIGYFSDKHGRRPFIIAGLIIMSITTILLGEIQTLNQFIIIRLIQGIAAGGVAAPAFALAADLSKEGGEGRQMSIVTMGFTLGIATGPLLSGLLAAVFFELPFWIIGIGTLVATVVVYRHLPETVEREIAQFEL